MRSPRACRFRRAALLFLVPLLAAGCVTASTRYEQGLRLEERGRPAEAARRYVDALRRDPSLDEARVRLQETGDLAVEQALAAATASNAEDAGDRLLELDALVRDADAVGVRLALPADYADRRRDVLDRAWMAALDRGEDHADEGRFADALRQIDRAGRYDPSSAQREEMEEGRVDVYTRWTEAELAAGRYRAAYDVAERAMQSLGRGHPELGPVLAAQARAVEEGTVRVAVLPLAAAGRAADSLPAGFLRDVEDALEAGPFADAPLFVEVIDPRLVRRELRGRGGRPTTMAVQSAARALGADLVVTMEVDSTWARDSDTRTERRTARLRTGPDTAYTVVSGRRERMVRVAWTVMDVGSRRTLDSGHLTAAADARFREGRFPGDWRQLLLSRDERVLFDRDRLDETDHDLRTALAGELARHAAAELYDRVLRLVD